jgi:hypothetical protein
MENESQGGPNRRNEKVNEIRRRRLCLALHSRMACLTTLAVGAEALRPHRQSPLLTRTLFETSFKKWYHNMSPALLFERIRQ